MEWQPIETAPKDILVILSDGQITSLGWYDPVNTEYPWRFVDEDLLTDGGDLIRVNGWSISSPPTHWMSLPRPPK